MPRVNFLKIMFLIKQTTIYFLVSVSLRLMSTESWVLYLIESDRSILLVLFLSFIVKSES